MSSSGSAMRSGGSRSSSSADSGDWPAERGLMHDGALGLTFEHAGADEAEFLFQEIVVRRSYLQGGVRLPDGGLELPPLLMLHLKAAHDGFLKVPQKGLELSKAVRDTLAEHLCGRDTAKAVSVRRGIDVRLAAHDRD